MKFFLITFAYFFIFFSQVYAADDIATPSTYKVTMKKVELCTSSACTTTTLLAETDGTFNTVSYTHLRAHET